MSLKEYYKDLFLINNKVYKFDYKDDKTGYLYFYSFDTYSEELLYAPKKYLEINPFIKRKDNIYKLDECAFIIQNTNQLEYVYNLISLFKNERDPIVDIQHQYSLSDYNEIFKSHKYLICEFTLVSDYFTRDDKYILLVISGDAIDDIGLAAFIENHKDLKFIKIEG